MNVRSVRFPFAHARNQAQARSQGQALVELALVLPLLFGIIVVLFQFGVLFISYLAMVHMTRDVGRWLAVHPDSYDSEVQAHVQADLPTVIGPTRVIAGGNQPNYSTYFGALGSAHAGELYVGLSPTCSVKSTLGLTQGHCVDADDSAHRNLVRVPGTSQHVTLAFDARSSMFLPTVFRFGPWFAVTLPSAQFTYDYFVMTEPA